MELRRLQSFIAVAEELHFGRAAELIHLSQPALSLQISGLEEELGVKLFIRSRRKTALSPAGQIFLEGAREVLKSTERAVSTVRRAALGHVGVLRIGFISTAAAVITPVLIKQFRELYPHVALELRNILTQDQLIELRDQKIDVGFLRGPIPPQSSIRARVIHREPFAIFVPAGHPLAGRVPLRLADCADADFVMYTRKMAPGFHDQIIGMLRREGITPRVVQEAAEMYTLVSLVSAGLGIAIAPASVALHQVPGVVVRPLEREAERSEISIAWNAENTSATANLFVQMALAKYCPKKGTRRSS